MSDYLLAIDLGSSKIAALLFDLNLKTEVSRYTYQIDYHSAGINEIHNFLSSVKIGQSICRVVLSSAPTINTKGNITHWANMPHWVGIPIIDILKNKFQVEIQIIDDGCSAALSEAHAYSLTNMLYIGIGSGIGGCYVKYNKKHSKYLLSIVNIGHLCVNDIHTVCSCGKRGCLQNLFSGRSAVKTISNKNNISLTDYYNINKKIATFSTIATEYFLLGVKSLNFAISLLEATYHPEYIVFGGGFFFAIKEKLLPLIRSQAIVHASKFTYKSSLEGAKLIASRDLSYVLY